MRGSGVLGWGSNAIAGQRLPAKVGWKVSGRGADQHFRCFFGECYRDPEHLAHDLVPVDVRTPPSITDTAMILVVVAVRA
jgi:hypothetical protein